MAWSTYSIISQPASLRDRLGPALANCQTLSGAYRADDAELAIDWAQDLHPTAELAAALVGALVDPKKTVDVYGHLRFPALLANMWRLDLKQKTVIAALVGLDMPDLDADDHETAIAASAEMRAAFNRHVRGLLATPALAGWFAVRSPDDGTHISVRPTGYRDDDGDPAGLALYSRPRKDLREMNRGDLAALIGLTTAYSDTLAKDRFKGAGLKMDGGEGAAALWQIRDPALRVNVIGMLANYCGW